MALPFYSEGVVLSGKRCSPFGEKNTSFREIDGMFWVKRPFVQGE